MGLNELRTKSQVFDETNHPFILFICLHGEFNLNMAITPFARVEQQDIYDIKNMYLDFSNATKYNDEYSKTDNKTQLFAGRHT